MRMMIVPSLRSHVNTAAHPGGVASVRMRITGGNDVSSEMQNA